MKPDARTRKRVLNGGRGAERDARGTKEEPGRAVSASVFGERKQG